VYRLWIVMVATKSTASRSTAPSRVRSWELFFVYLVFVASGFAALLYQVSWQRALFAIFGINIEAVTVVVTAFMLGLGAGSWIGGALSELPNRPMLLYFAGIEASIGAFGLGSLWLFDLVGRLTLHAPSSATACISFALVLAPTMLMGATLPLLVAYAVRSTGSVGRSVGMLYFVNTLGSSIAAFVAVLVCLPRLGLSDTIRLAAITNLLVATVAVVLHARRRGKS
jgi:predicted membrane-bound spermidine synthase